MTEARLPAYYSSTAASMAIRSPAPRVVVLTISGHDIGEFGARPMKRLEHEIPDDQSVELFIDARRARGVSIDVSSAWALWLGENASRFRRIHMLTGSHLVKITAEFVRRFSSLDGLMTIYTDSGAFEDALATATMNAR